MKNMPCEVIEDLLPSYTEELTHSVTNEIVEEHFEQCEACKQKFERMKNPMVEKTEKEVKEIDFLKKTKKRYQGWILIWALAIFLVVFILMGVKTYVAGTYMNSDYLFYNLDVSESYLKVAVNATSDAGIQSVHFSEKQGIVEIIVRSVPKSLIYKKSATGEFVASEKIRQVWIGDRIVWAEGEQISPLTSKLYAKYNPYIGNMPANGEVVGALNMVAYTGNFKNELQTSEEPYAWKMIFQNDFSKNREEAFLNRLTKYAYLLLADIGNLGEVIFEYTVEGEPKTVSVTSQEASEFLGTDIKSTRENIVLLERLVRKTDLSNIMLGGESVTSNEQVNSSNSDGTDEVLGLTVINYATDHVIGMSVSVESNNEVAHQSMVTASGAALKDGENVSFQLLPEDFGAEIDDGSKGIIRLKIQHENGEYYEVQGEVYADLYWGSKYRMMLSGDAQNGYFLSK